MSHKITNEAEFLLHVAEEQSLPKLKRLLEGAGIERALPILRRINDLFEGNNAEVLLSLAVRSFHQGQDEDASIFLEQARRLRPEDQQVLRVAIFFAAAYGENDEAKDLCRRLLAVYPDDEWAKAMDEKLSKGGRILNLNLPPLTTEWEAALNRNA
jgi:tetratricopeptide (TPR) repeat protein